MIPRIREVKPLPDYNLSVVFDDGKAVIYDVMDDIRQIESYRDLVAIHGRSRHGKAEGICQAVRPAGCFP